MACASKQHSRTLSYTRCYQTGRCAYQPSGICSLSINSSLSLSLPSMLGARAPRGGVTRQGVVLTDLQLLCDCQYNFSVSLDVSPPLVPGGDKISLGSSSNQSHALSWHAQVNNIHTHTFTRGVTRQGVALTNLQSFVVCRLTLNRCR